MHQPYICARTEVLSYVQVVREGIGDRSNRERTRPTLRHTHGLSPRNQVKHKRNHDRSSFQMQGYCMVHVHKRRNCRNDYSEERGGNGRNDYSEERGDDAHRDNSEH